MKFIARARIREIRSDLQESRRCYLTTVMLPKKLKASHSTLENTELPPLPSNCSLIDPWEESEVPHRLEPTMGHPPALELGLQDLNMPLSLRLSALGLLQLLGSLTSPRLGSRYRNQVGLLLELSNLTSELVNDSLDSCTLSVSPMEKW
ncbi:hypothetical protein BHE74_00014195 [Ensete ventricosum]|nr:hypothetical protein BHE74_00014195 [Ensete ventricosum]